MKCINHIVLLVIPPYVKFVRYCPKTTGAYTESISISPELPALV